MVDALLFLLLFLGVPAGVTALCFMTMGPSPQAIVMSFILVVLALGFLADYRRDAFPSRSSTLPTSTILWPSRTSSRWSRCR